MEVLSEDTFYLRPLLETGPPFYALIPSYSKGYPFVGQRHYLHFSVILRPKYSQLSFRRKLLGPALFVRLMLSQLKLVNKGGQSRCPSHRGVHPTEVSILQRCPSHKSVHLTEVSISQKRPFHRSVHLTELSISQTCPLRGS